MITKTFPLRYGLVAEIVAGDEDRPPYVAPPAPPTTELYQHLARCPCPKCADARRARGERPAPGTVISGELP